MLREMVTLNLPPKDTPRIYTHQQPASSSESRLWVCSPRTWIRPEAAREVPGRLCTSAALPQPIPLQHLKSNHLPTAAFPIQNLTEVRRDCF